MALIRCSSSAGGGGTVYEGTVTLSTSTTTTVNIGFKPKVLTYTMYKDDTHFFEHYYNTDISDSNVYRGGLNGSSAGAYVFSLPVTSSTAYPGKILSISNDGTVTFDKGTSATGLSGYIHAIG